MGAQAPAGMRCCRTPGPLGRPPAHQGRWACLLGRALSSLHIMATAVELCCPARTGPHRSWGRTLSIWCLMLSERPDACIGARSSHGSSPRSSMRPLESSKAPSHTWAWQGVLMLVLVLLLLLLRWLLLHVVWPLHVHGPPLLLLLLL